MSRLRIILGLFFICLFGSIQAQDLTTLSDEEMNGTLKEGTLVEDGNSSLILDNTRTKIGRDFYETFYRQWSATSVPVATELPGDSIETGARRPDVFNQEEFLITIEEVPTPNVGTTIVTITINDQLLWQQFLQARLDIIEALATNAVEVVTQYVANYQEIQAQMNSADQSGTGIF
ncbi:CsgE family curli-type amyloid fiber assembly protein [Tellurirhabdus rosea]|uniref:CsgE family curli-type amyloid fiber assembly protein n=1 Tax=Tellurirhabdus rosea TaxID=2674997 RepID=UPI00224E9263|nr:CsgE family curli-type amyloid fiber assembly protein [Tellurirhabdus rosea]